ncbi:hypothetical protein BJY16_001827 [Actinoplanes octamycinicus]|uniref:Uncharacterized protein n=1 Tax=Actinoplanes octamycinicus TaxID=135948 RepID=A0A7W7GU75_9ACTN|nr:hypothetical protein [Actinoplanes octamycinicus]MBB4738368.1 hypothetical protein [Actinoplanes octamycinicus]
MPTAQLGAIHAALGKWNPRGEGELQLTRHNWQTMVDDPARFRALDVWIWSP